MPRPAPGGFAEAFGREMRRWNESPSQLARVLAGAGAPVAVRRLAKWRCGEARPAGAASLEIVAAIERRYGLDPGTLAARAGPRPALPRALQGISWHLPDDFLERGPAEQAQVLAWVRSTFRGQTPYRRFQAQASRQRFRVRFPGAEAAPGEAATRTGRRRSRRQDVVAVEPLASQAAALMAFKTARLSPPGRPRRGSWGAATAGQTLGHLGLVFGALAAAPDGPVRGLGAPLERLSMAMLCLPKVWDAYLGWREARRGFFTRWEANLLETAAALTHPVFGWLTQTPELADTLQPIPGLVDEADIAALRDDWAGACAGLHRYARMRAGEIVRLARVHRDPFEAITPVLEAAEPLAEYLKIADEILRHSPDEALRPLRHAEAMRAWLMLRLGLHLGFRGRNLRELLVCLPGQPHRTERVLADLRAAELRWSADQAAWEVFAPAQAFKNARSAFFRGGPFQLTLPDRGGLYARIDAWLARHRPRLLAGAPDPGVFFVRHVKAPGDDPALDRFRFHECWSRMIERYGVFNPWTGRGAIVGLLPHGPHALRAVLATQVLKATGSFEEAGYAIQDMPEAIVRHYGRFLPREKLARAQSVLDRVWLASSGPAAPSDAAEPPTERGRRLADLNPSA